MHIFVPIITVTFDKGVMCDPLKVGTNLVK